MPIPSVTDDIFLLQEAILINCSRGPVIDEAALVDHLRENPMFRVGLDVFEVI
jgi:hydroxypyruvate reductase 1